MAMTVDTGEHKVTRSDIFLVDPRALIVDWHKNLSRGGVEPPVDEALMDLGRDMVPRKGPGDTAEGTSGQLNPILVRKLADRRLEVVGGFRRMRAALWLIESGECPDFKVKYVVSTLSDAEAALINMCENINREDTKPMQLAHAVRSFTEDYGMTIELLAGRFKRSAGYLTQLLNLVTLPSELQSSIINGETTVTAGLELAKLDGPVQREIFDEVKATGGKKVKVNEVKAAVRKKKEEAGEATQKKLTVRDVRDFLDFKSGPVEDETGRKVAELMLDFMDGKTTEEQTRKRWDRIFSDARK
jgi:ParB/RepB/Spo0J family partition protein